MRVSFKASAFDLLFSLGCCLHLLPSAVAQMLPMPMEILRYPLPPGERSPSHLLHAPDGDVYGIVPTSDGNWRFFRIARDEAGSITVVKQVPGLVVPPAKLVAGGNGAWQWDFSHKTGYVLTANGHLMSYGADGATRDLGQVSGTRPFEEKTGFQLSRTLLITPGGDLYTGGDQGFLFRYTPGSDAVEKLEARLPAVVGREPWASLDAAIVAADGTIYGGTFDGYIFSFDPRTLAVINAGKPFRSQRIAALIFRDGLLYGVGGSEEHLPRVFSFNPQTRNLTLGGLLTHGITPRLLNYYEPVGDCARDAMGNVYFSTTGRLAQIYRWKK